VNAFETAAGDIVFDICAYADNSHMEAFRLATLRNNSFAIPSGQLRRYTLPLGEPAATKVAWTVTGATSFDLPAINGAFAGRDYRFVYGIGDAAPGDWWNTLVKVDVRSGATLTWARAQHWPSEPIFVADPSAAGVEDAGVLLSIVLAADINQVRALFVVCNRVVSAS
jgi:carotenoid cleavage dioxygenase-like enzyme